MSTAAQNARRAWTNDDVARLKQLLVQRTPIGVVALKLGRSRGAVKAKIAALGLAATVADPASGSAHGA